MFLFCSVTLAVRIPEPAASGVQVHIVAVGRRSATGGRQVRGTVDAGLQVPGRVAHLQVRATARGHHRTGSRGSADQLAQVRAQVRTELVQAATAAGGGRGPAGRRVRTTGRPVQIRGRAGVQVRATGARVRR